MLPVATDQLGRALAELLDTDILLYSHHPVGGGCIHHGGVIRTNRGAFFLKWNTADAFPMFEAEQKGLQALRHRSSLLVPMSYGTFTLNRYAFLLLEYFPHQPATALYWERFGIGLAELHRNSADRYGFEEDNFIGSLPQSNRWHTTFVDFFIHERLLPQIQRAQQEQRLTASHQRQFDHLFAQLPHLLPEESPALLHGDLWSGNCFATTNSGAVIVDPAVYYGHREAELAFTLLFGGFHDRFYQSYHSHFPLLPDWRQRVDLYNLYPLLVHLNLFGSSYLPDIERILRRYT